MSYRTASEAAGVSLGTVQRISGLRAFRRKRRAGRGVKRLVAHPARAWRPALLAMWWTFQPIGFGGSSFSAMRQVSTAT
jgi:hypothetical protein